MKKPIDWSPEQNAAFERINKTLDVFETLSDQFPVSYMKMFMEIALKQGLSPTDYAQRLGKLKGPACRIIDSLGSHPRRTEKCHELIEKFDDPIDARVKHVVLTSKGEQLAKKLLRAQGL